MFVYVRWSSGIDASSMVVDSDLQFLGSATYILFLALGACNQID